MSVSASLRSIMPWYHGCSRCSSLAMLITNLARCGPKQFSSCTPCIQLQRVYIKEKGYLERVDSRTRGASRNYELKSAKTELFKHSFFINTPKIWNNLPSVIKINAVLRIFQDSKKENIFNTSSTNVTPYRKPHQIRSRTPWRDTYIGFSPYNEEEEEQQPLNNCT